MYYTTLQSPVGPLMLAGDKEGLKYLSFETGKQPTSPQDDWQVNDPFFSEAIRQLQDYFRGLRKSFNLKLAPHGTSFQLKVLEVLQKIPYGQTMSYGEVAKKIGNPKACRAVGAANGRNPLSIFIPCHRVIGQTGKLVGFGGGLKIKEALLALEKKHVS